MKNKQGLMVGKTGGGIMGGFSLTFRLSLGITLLIMMLLAAVGTGSYLRDRETFMQEAVSRGWTTVHTVQTFAGDHMANGNYNALHNLISTLEKDPLIARATILDQEGKILMRHIPGQTGTMINDAAALKAIEKGSENMGYLRNDQGQALAITFTAPLTDSAAETRGYFYLAVDLGWVHAHLQEALHSLLFNFVLAALAGLILTRLIILRSVHRPVQALVEATENISTGDFSGKLTVTTRDELGRLAQAFNTMSQHLGVLFKSVQDTVQDMNHASSTIVKHTQRIKLEEDVQGTDTRFREEVIQEINSNARKINRMSDKLNSLAMQFKTQP